METLFTKISFVFAIVGLVGGAMPLTAQGDDKPVLKPYSYRVSLPAGTTDCATHAQALAEKFAAATQAQSVTGTCQSRQAVANDSTYQVDTVVISYQSPYEFSPYRVIIGGTNFMNTPMQRASLFASYDGCLSEMQHQEKLFETETGLTLLDAYCTASDDLNPGYSMTLESFGTPQRNLYAFSQRNPINGNAAQTTLIQAASLAVTSSGGDIAYSDANHLFYYAPSDIQITVDVFGIFSDVGQCSDQQSETQKIFAGAGLTGTTIYCDPFSATNTSQVTLTAVGAGPNEVQDDYGLTSDKYGSYSECQSDRARVEQNATSDGYQVLGTICEPDESLPSNFVVHVFTHAT